MEEAVALLKNSKTGATLVSFALRSNINIVINEEILTERASFDPNCNTVEISIGCFNNQGIFASALVLAHELRHARQHYMGCMKNINNFNHYISLDKIDTDVFYLFNRVLVETRFAEADAYSIMLQISYELLETGHVSDRDIGALFTSNIYNKHMFTAMRKSIKENKNNLQNGCARKKAFDSFFNEKAITFGKNIYIAQRLLYDLNCINTLRKLVKLYKIDSNSLRFNSDKEKLKGVFNLSARDSRKLLPPIYQLRKFGEMETGGNYLTNTPNSKSLHSAYYTNLTVVIRLLYNHLWKKARKSFKNKLSLH